MQKFWARHVVYFFMSVLDLFLNEKMNLDSELEDVFRSQTTDSQYSYPIAKKMFLGRKPKNAPAVWDFRAQLG